MFNKIQSDKRRNAINLFFNKIKNLPNVKENLPHINNSVTSGITVMNLEMVEKMTICIFQEMLHSRHIIVTINNLSIIPCDCRGLLSLNDLKEIVDIEGTIITLT